LPEELPPPAELPACGAPPVSQQLFLKGVRSTDRVRLRRDETAAAAARTLLSHEFSLAHRGTLADSEPESCESIRLTFYRDPQSEAVGRSLREVRGIPGVLDVKLVA